MCTYICDVFVCFLNYLFVRALLPKTLTTSTQEGRPEPVVEVWARSENCCSHGGRSRFFFPAGVDKTITRVSWYDEAYFVRMHNTKYETHFFFPSYDMVIWRDGTAGKAGTRRGRTAVIPPRNFHRRLNVLRPIMGVFFGSCDRVRSPKNRLLLSAEVRKDWCHFWGHHVFNKKGAESINNLWSQLGQTRTLGDHMRGCANNRVKILLGRSTIRKRILSPRNILHHCDRSPLRVSRLVSLFSG